MMACAAVVPMLGHHVSSRQAPHERDQQMLDHPCGSMLMPQDLCWARRLKAVDSGASDEEVEEQFTMQLEQLIKQCEDELGLIPKMAEWKPWDVPPGHKVPLCSASEQNLSCPC